MTPLPMRSVLPQRMRGMGDWAAMFEYALTVEYRVNEFVVRYLKDRNMFVALGEGVDLFQTLLLMLYCLLYCLRG